MPSPPICHATTTRPAMVTDRTCGARESRGFLRAPMKCLLGVLGAVLIAALPAASLAQPFARRAPRFTAEQAARGKAAYAANCAQCHGADLKGSGGGKSLVDDAFRQQWHDLTPAGLYGYVAGQMPLNAPGSLDPQVYSDIASYIF